jgi:hypothetical protein
MAGGFGFRMASSYRHSGESRNPFIRRRGGPKWIPALAGMTIRISHTANRLIRARVSRLLRRRLRYSCGVDTSQDHPIRSKPESG